MFRLRAHSTPRILPRSKHIPRIYCTKSFGETHLVNFANTSRVVQDTFRERGLARVNMCRYTNIPLKPQPIPVLLGELEDGQFRLNGVGLALCRRRHGGVSFQERCIKGG